MAETILILHQRSLRSDAFETGSFAVVLILLIALVLIVGALCGLHFTAALVLMAILFGLAFAGLLLYSTVSNFRTGGHFRSMLTTRRLVCESPLKSQGESFALWIDEIAFIEEHSGSADDSSSTCYLRNLNGDIFWLTRNYGNPTAKILDRLEELNPKIQTRYIS